VPAAAAGGKHKSEVSCLDCHKNPHKPLNIVLAAKTTEPCLTCHTEQIQQLKESPSRHSSQYCSSCHDVHRKIPECVKCHENRHKTVPGCQQCHPGKHPASIMKRFPKCGRCHNVAHDLNHWPEDGGGARPKAAPAKAEKRKR